MADENPVSSTGWGIVDNFKKPPSRRLQGDWETTDQP